MKKIQIIIWIIVMTLLKQQGAFAQITCKSSLLSYKKATRYYADSSFITFHDFVDTIFFLEKEAYLDSLNGKQFYLTSDTVYTKDSAYYILSEKNFSGYNESFLKVYQLILFDTLEFEYFTVTYPDSVYVFNMDIAQSDSSLGSLTAMYPAGIDSANFIWTRYDSVSGNFNDTLHIAKDTGISTISDLGNGGYQAYVSGGAKDTSFHAWVFNNFLYMSIDSMKNDSNHVKNIFYDCFENRTYSEVKKKQFRYFDHYADTSITLPNDVMYHWELFKKEDWSESDSRFTNPGYPTPRIVTDLPYEDTYYVLTVQDSFHFERKDTVLYKSIIPKSDFIAYYKHSKVPEEEDYTSVEDNTEVIGGDVETGSGPIRVLYKNESKNAVEFNWDYGDDYDIAQDLEVGYTSYEYDQYHIYYVPDDYTLRLIAISEAECEDTLEISPKVTVVESELGEIPTVFTPNGDGINDMFKIQMPNYATLKYYEITIYNAQGRKVFEYSGDINTWDGWDGTIRNSDRLSKAGVYYYFIKAAGWEQEPEVNYDSDEYSGFFHLFR